MNNVIIAPREYHNYLRELYRKDDVFANPKIFTKDEVVAAYFGSIDSDFVYELLKERKYSYEFYKKLVRFLPLVKNHDSEKENEIISYFEKAKENYLTTNEYLFEFLRNGVDIYVYHNDRILDYIFEKENITDIENKKIETTYHNDELLTFKNEREEAHYVINKILALIDEGVNVDDIYIFGIDSSNSYYYSYFSEMYDLHLNDLTLGSAFKSFYYKKFREIYDKDSDFESVIKELDDAYILDGDCYLKVRNAIVENYRKDLPFDLMIEVFDNVLSNKEIASIKCTNSINLLKNTRLLQGKYIFCVDFNNKKYPTLKNDKDFINDKIKARNFINTTSEINAYNKKIMLDFLSLDNQYFYSFSQTGLGGKKYVSFLVKDLNLKELNLTIMPYDYDENMARYTLSMMEDVLRKYKERNPLYDSYNELIENQNYFTYTNQAGNIEAIKKEQFMKLSYSSVSTYENCPFQYLISRVFKIKDEGEMFDMDFGTLVHNTFELSYRSHKDFETNFRNVFSELHFSEVEQKFIASLYPKILDAYNFSIEHLKNCNNPKIFLEHKIDYKFDDNTILEGKIDKAIVTNNKYLFLFDYKTGATPKKLTQKSVINLKEMQLPTYLLLAGEDNDLKNYEVKGLYFDNVFMPDYNIYDQYDHKYFGLSAKDLDALSSIDKTIDNVGQYVNGYKLDGKLSTDYFVESIDFLNMKNITDRYYKDLIINLRNNKFEIKPKEQKTCERCTFKDICFYKKEYTDEEDE